MKITVIIGLLSSFTLCSLTSELVFAAEPEPPTILSRHVAVPNYCAWPNLAKLPDGSLAAVVYNQPHHGGMVGEVECWVSPDGKAWRLWGNPTSHDLDANRMNVAFGVNAQVELVLLASGWTLKPQKLERMGRGLNKIQQVWCSRSSDGGKTWKLNKDGFPPPAEGLSPYVPFGDIMIAEDGSLRVTAYARNETTLDSEATWMFRSTDGGSTWTILSEIATAHSEGALFSLGKGHWLAALRKVADDEPMDLYRSTDDGRTWKFQEQVTEARQHPGDFIRLDDGRLLLSFGSRQDGKFGCAAKLSSDDGKTWGPTMLLVSDCNDFDCGYASSAQLADGTIVTGYYASGTKDRPGYQFNTVLWKAPPKP